MLLHFAATGSHIFQINIVCFKDFPNAQMVFESAILAFSVYYLLFKTSLPLNKIAIRQFLYIKYLQYQPDNHSSEKNDTNWFLFANCCIETILNLNNLIKLNRSLP